MSHRYFGDVVTFDATYRINKYDMPFAPFTGVNHHSQSIQFGCALLQDESEVTFIWLFETWLEAMGGHYPISIITDQDLAMKGAIAKVLPKTRHRLCFWHIKKEFGEKLLHLYFKKSNFKVEIKKCIWSMRKIYFERRWKTLMIKHELQKNTWLEHLYEIRASWVSVYNWDTFYAGMNTTGRSESINSFFDAFVTSQTNLREFVVKYEQALKKIVTSESIENFESEHKYRIVKDIEFLLKHASTLYTRNVFKKFKYEWDQVNHYRVEEVECENECATYLLEPKVGEFEGVVVKFNLHTHEGSCECKKFEFLGIPCRHILKLLVRLDIDTIPAHFILARWLQGANKFRVMDATLDNDNNENLEALRLSHMCQESSKLACYASSSYEKYKMYMETLKELSKRLESFKDEDVTNPSTNIPEDTNAPNDMETQSTQAFSRLFLLDPNISQTKGRNNDTKSGANGKGSGRMKGGFELAMEKRKRKCQLCYKSAGHDKHNCPLNTKKGNKRLMESESEETDDAQSESNTDTDQDS